MAKGPGGIISGGFDPLNAPDAPTIDSVSAGVLTADVTFSAPADTGAGTVDSYVITAKQGDEGVATATPSSAGTVSISLPSGGTTTFAAQAISNAFGPGAFSGFGNSTSVFSGQELYTFGLNSLGQLGLQDTTNRSSPVQVGTLTNWAEVSGCDVEATAAIKTDGTLWSWGKSNYGQLGDNTTVNKSSPVQVGALTNWSKISAGRFDCFAVKTDGTLWSWGRNNNGQLGHNDTVSRSSPVQVGAGTNWAEVAPGGTHALALTTDGELYSWGSNTAGWIGDNTTVSKSSPIQIGALTNWSKISAGYNSLAVKTDGTLWSWGQGISGRLGDNTSVNKSSPIQIGSETNWSKIFTGLSSNFAITTSGELYAWGYNGYGSQLGDNTNITRSSPVQIGSLTNWFIASVGGYKSGAVKTDGTLWSWGRNSSGQLGHNDTVSKSSPVQVGGETNWSKISAGGRNHFVALALV